MRWYEDVDGNFVEQFQTTGFDARMWELYLFAMLVEAGYSIDRAVAIPDFQARSLLGEVSIEATTVNPSRDAQGTIVPPPPLDTPAQAMAFQNDYMPIKFAGPLTDKLAKRYWERANVAGRPLVLAIQDFHAPMSMTISTSSLPKYLYGIAHDWKHDEAGKLVITPRKLSVHRWGSKEVPSGFFSLPDAENVSAVITNGSATISKFNRIGMIAGFGSKRVRLVREGLAVDPDPNATNPRRFVHEVNSADYRETWMEGMDVFHNPSARIPLDPGMLPGAAHHRLLSDGQLQTLAPAWHPLGTRTHITIAE